MSQSKPSYLPTGSSNTAAGATATPAYAQNASADAAPDYLRNCNSSQTSQGNPSYVQSGGQANTGNQQNTARPAYASSSQSSYSNNTNVQASSGAPAYMQTGTKVEPGNQAAANLPPANNEPTKPEDSSPEIVRKSEFISRPNHDLTTMQRPKKQKTFPCLLMRSGIVKL